MFSFCPFNGHVPQGHRQALQHCPMNNLLFINVFPGLKCRMDRFYIFFSRILYAGCLRFYKVQNGEIQTFSEFDPKKNAEGKI